MLLSASVRSWKAVSPACSCHNQRSRPRLSFSGQVMHATVRCATGRQCVFRRQDVNWLSVITIIDSNVRLGNRVTSSHPRGHACCRPRLLPALPFAAPSIVSGPPEDHCHHLRSHSFETPPVTPARGAWSSLLPDRNPPAPFHKLLANEGLMQQLCHRRPPSSDTAQLRHCDYTSYIITISELSLRSCHPRLPARTPNHPQTSHGGV